MQRKLPKHISPGVGAALLALALPAVTARSVPAQSAETGSRDALYQGGLTNLRALSRYFTPAQAARTPTLQAILHRVVYETDGASDDELAIGTSLIMGQPISLGGGKAAGMSQAILALHFKPLVAVNVSPAQAASVVKPIARTVNAGYVKIAAASKAVTYSPGVVRKPGGTESGYVDMVRGAKRTRIVEIPTAVGDLGVSARAGKIATRMASVQRQDPAWWSRITPGQSGGEAVVSLPHGPVPYLLTADSSFAREWNTTPDGLAQRLVTRIRAAIQTSGARGALTTPEDEAVREKQAGDDAYTKGDAAGAERRYRQAIKDSPGYVAAYKSLISLYKERKKVAQVQDVITEAQGEPSLTDAQLQEIKQAGQ